MKRILQATVLGLLLLNVFFAYSSFALAQSQQDSYVGSGAEASIKQYLCTPSPATSAGKDSLKSHSSSGEIDSNAAAANNTASGDLYTCINKIYRFAIVVAGVFGVLMIVVAGYVYMSADGSEEAVSKAKEILTTTIVSMVILMAGYVLLKALNPDLIQFQKIQPNSVVLPSAAPPSPTNIVVTTDSSGNVVSVSGGAGKTAAELTASHCAFQTPKQSNEVPNMTQALFDKVKAICSAVYASTNQQPQISSVIGQGQHAANSYHYKGCAVDFADGNGNGFFDIKTGTGRPVGVALYNAAKSQGMRIDPSPDDQQSFHLHADLYTSCPSQ